MKKIFIYFSLTNNGDVVSDVFKDNGYDIRKVEPDEKMPKSTFLRILKGGYLAMRNHKPKLKNFDSNIESYKEIIIGSPIWNGRLACPINSVLDILDLKDKKLSFIFYSGSGSSPKATEKVSMLYPKAEIINMIEPKNNLESLKSLQ